MLALAFFALDWREADAEEQGAEQAAAWSARRGGGRAWHFGHYGFQYYSKRRGMTPACAALDEAAPPHLRRGAWLVQPDGRVASQLLDFDAPALQEDAALTLGEPAPLRTVSCF